MLPELHVASGKHRSRVRGLVEVGVASVLWGTGEMAVQLIRAQEPLSPLTISTWRMAIAAVILLVALLALRRGGALLSLTRSSPRRLLAVGVGTATYKGFYFVAVTQVGVGVAVATVVSLGARRSSSRSPIRSGTADRPPLRGSPYWSRPWAASCSSAWPATRRRPARPGRRRAAGNRVADDVRPDHRGRWLDQPDHLASRPDKRHDARRRGGAVALPSVRGGTPGHDRPGGTGLAGLPRCPDDGVGLRAALLRAPGRRPQHGGHRQPGRARHRRCGRGRRAGRAARPARCRAGSCLSSARWPSLGIRRQWADRWWGKPSSRGT